MRNQRLVLLCVAVSALAGLFPAIAGAELVKRNMFVDSAGKTVSQYVYQGGRTRSSRGSTHYGSGYYSYGYGYTPYYSGYYPARNYLGVRPVFRGHGHARGGGVHVRGSFSGGRAQVRIRR